MRWARFLLALGLAGGLALAPGPVTGQQQCSPEALPLVGTLELRGRDSGQIENGTGAVLPVAGYEFSVRRSNQSSPETNAVATTDYAPLVIRKPVDASTHALEAVRARREALSHVALTVHDARRQPLFTYRFGLAEIVEHAEATATDGCAIEEIHLRTGAVHITHEPSGASIIHSGQLGTNRAP